MSSCRSSAGTIWSRTVAWQAGPKAQLLAEEKSRFLPLPEAVVRGPTDGARARPIRCRWCVSTRNDYSVPTQYAHREHDDRGGDGGGPAGVRGSAGGQASAVTGARSITVFDPIHYLALLERKPGGLDFAKPLEDWHCRSASASCGDVWRRSWTSTGPGSSSRCCGCWNDATLQGTRPVRSSYALSIGVIRCRCIRLILEHRGGSSRSSCSRWMVGRIWRRAGSDPPNLHAYQALLVGGVAMTKIETKSTVLLKHHLKALKLPTMHAECEKVAARCAPGERRSSGVPACSSANWN